MTREEAARPFAMLKANWPFLDFSQEETFEVWYAALSRYVIEEVLQGVQDAIEGLKHTPTVADVLDYVKNVREGRRRAEHEFNRQLFYEDTVKCAKCNDHGYVTIIFPNGDQGMRACDCEAGHARYGKHVYEYQESPAPPSVTLRLFNGGWKEDVKKVVAKYKLVKCATKGNKSEIVYRYERRE